MSLKEVKEFKVNEYITLKLEYGKTYIYIKGKRFDQCKFLLLEIEVDKISSLDDIESVDEAAQRLDGRLEPIENSLPELKIDPETEFWGHCSNLQVWVESNYDTRLLHSNIAFPLLKRLTEVGDLIAKRVFKEEIVKRIHSKYFPVVQYLEEEEYFDYLNREEKEIAFSDYDKVVVEGETILVIGYELYLSGMGIQKISEIKGLSKCTYLKKLVLAHNNIEKINGLENLVNLTDLRLNENKIKKIEGLDNLANLNVLIFDKNQIEKIEGLNKLVNLRELILSNNKIIKIEGLENNYSILTINLRRNFIKKIEGLESLKKLQKLYLSFNNIEIIEGLRDISKLVYLDISHNQISKIEGLDTVNNLKQLLLEFNKIKKIENLNVLNKLQELNISNNQIEKIEGLTNLNQLVELHLNDNPIKSIEGLENLHKLEDLYLKNIKVPIDFLKKLGAFENIYSVKNAQTFVKYCKKLKKNIEVKK